MNNITMARLGYIVMTMFEMQASHLFCFEVPLGQNYYQYMKERLSEEELNNHISFRNKNEVKRFEVQNEMTAEFEDEDALNAASEKLPHIITWVGDKLMLQYDYGDSWEVKLVLEQILRIKICPERSFLASLKVRAMVLSKIAAAQAVLRKSQKPIKRKRGSNTINTANGSESMIWIWPHLTLMI